MRFGKAGLKACSYVHACGCRPSSLPWIAAVLFATVALQAADPSVWDGVYTAEQARRGEAAYLGACASCHGTALEGGDMTPPLVGGTFTSNWNELTVGDLFERIRTTMPLDMPGRLSRQQNADVIAFMLKANGWPMGTPELAADPAALKQIRIEAVKPSTQER
jgi:S-disulfanyl-L-cysteine oxidoreductase SoxD